MAEEKKQETKGEEREYTIPLRSKWIKEARYKKTNKAVKAVKEFLARHMKIRDRNLNKIKLDTYLNNFLWLRGIKNPPARVNVKAFREGDVVRVELLDFPDKIKFRKDKLDKRERKAQEIQEKKSEEAPKEESKDEEKSAEEEKEDPETQKEKEEKKASVVEAGKEQAKKAAKMAKHQTKITKQPKQQQRKALKK